MKMTIYELIAQKAQADVTIVFAETTEYEHSTETVFINPNDEDIGAFGFFRHLRDCHHCELGDALPPHIWGFLHELGHYFTIDYCEEDRFARWICAITPAEVAEKSVKIQNMYFNMQSEWEATEWAIGFVEGHFKWLRSLCE